MNRIRCTAASLAILGMTGACDHPVVTLPEKPHQLYAMRGVVSQVATDGGTGDLLIHHEAVPDFVDDSGRKSTMPAMTMPFTPAAGVTFEGLKVGDLVTFTLDVDWANSKVVVTRIGRLAPGTQLNLGAMPHQR